MMTKELSPKNCKFNDQPYSGSCAGALPNRSYSENALNPYMKIFISKLGRRSDKLRIK